MNNLVQISTVVDALKLPVSSSEHDKDDRLYFGVNLAAGVDAVAIQHMVNAHINNFAKVHHMVLRLETIEKVISNYGDYSLIFTFIPLNLGVNNANIKEINPA